MSRVFEACLPHNRGRDSEVTGGNRRCRLSEFEPESACRTGWRTGGGQARTGEED